MSVSLTARRLGLSALFLLTGLALSSWITRTPAIRDLLGASTGQMGLVMLGMSVGSMVGILCSGPLVMRFGARPLIVVGSCALVASMPVVGLGALVQADAVVAAGLALFGLGAGGTEIALNVEGADIEQRSGRSFLPLMHGCFSVGTVIGAVCGIVATATGFPVVLHLIIVGAAGLVLMLLAVPTLSHGTGRSPRGGADGAAKPQVWRDPALLAIAGVVLAMALAEGSANDWLPLVMVDGHGLDPALGSSVFAAFAAAMAIGRFIGGPIVTRFGRARVLGASAVSAVAGIALVVFVDHPVVIAAAVLLWGLGASLGFPVALSAAGASGDHATARVSLVTVIGYIAFLVGPPVLGFVGDHVGIRYAMVVPMVAAAAAIALTPAIGPRRSR